MKIFHFNIESPAGNFGDDVLFLSTKRTFENIFRDFKIEWVNYPLRNHTTDSVIDKANECDLIIVGGGGLLLRDTAANSYSGWQWACSLKHLNMIKKPLIIYSIGYNRFRDQDEFDPVFFEHLNRTIEKSLFFSVRDTGSKEALIKCGFCGDLIYVNPCPSIFYEREFAPQFTGIHVGINMAGDRYDLRFNKERFYIQMKKICDKLLKDGVTLHFFNHNWNPLSNCQDFIDSITRKHVHNIETVWDSICIKKALREYNSMDLIISMRSHAQLIPFGQMKKVLSIISHDKIKWFLDDAEMEDTGIDILDIHFEEKMIDLIEAMLINQPLYYQKRQVEALNKFRNTFNQNNARIRSLVG